MKRRGTIFILLLALILITATACGSDDKETTSQQPTESDTDVTVTADGNIEALFYARLTFSTGGKLDEIYVKEGDKVSIGDALAKLDTDTLELAFAQAQVTYLQTKATIDQAQVAVDQAQVTRDQAQAAIDQAQAAIDQAKVSLEQAELNLELTELWSSLTQIDIAESQVEVAESQLKVYESDLEVAKSQLVVAESQLVVAKSQLEVAKSQLVVAGQGITLAQKQLDEAILTAPFGGEVANVYADEGDSVLIGTTIIHLIDPTSLQLTARVDEFDIVKVKTGQKVLISVDAVPEAKLEGWVTFISPVAREPVGVVLFEDEDEEKSYEVKIDFDILENSPIRVGMNATAEIIVE